MPKPLPDWRDVVEGWVKAHPFQYALLVLRTLFEMAGIIVLVGAVLIVILMLHVGAMG